MPRARKLPQAEGAPVPGLGSPTAAAGGAAGGPSSPVGRRPPSRQPQRTPSGLPYGERAQLERDQRAAPLPQAGAPGGGQPAMVPRDRFAAALQAAKDMPFDDVPISARSERPLEPLTAGLAVGRGPGPEVLGRTGAPGVADTLRMLANATGDQEVASLADVARSQRA